jgi:iduronate 2-sulfatase
MSKVDATFAQLAALGGLMVAGSLMLANKVEAADRLNVLLICIDDLKPTLGCYGDPVAVTPHIDKLAASGVRFDGAYCNQAVCSPSRNSLMTGLRPQTIGIYDLPTHFRLAVPGAVTVGEYFKQRGYHVQGLGKILHTGHGNYDDKQSWSVPSWRPKAPSYVTEASLNNIVTDASGKKRGPATEAAMVSDETYSDGQIAAEAVKRLHVAAQSSDQPFFLAVGFLKPHLPFVAPQAYWDLYNPEQLPMPSVLEPPTGAPEYAPTTGGELRSYSDIDKGPVDMATTRHLIHGYYAATSYTDAQIGKVLDALESEGLADNTVVALWGDHGWHLGDHGMWCKHSNYEQATRIPLIIRAPASSPDRAPQTRDVASNKMGLGTASLVETVDVYPTLAELAGLEPPTSLDGVSFASIVRQPSTRVREYVTHVYPRGSRLGRAIRNERYRLVEWKPWKNGNDPIEYELYDYQQDPLETKNLVHEQPEVFANLLAVLADQPPAAPQK